MAKKKPANSSPDDVLNDALAQSAEQTQEAQRDGPSPAPSKAVSVDIPVSDEEKVGFRSRNVDVFLQPHESRVLSRVCRALVDSDASVPRLKNGKVVGTRKVANMQDAFRWILSELGQKTGLIPE